jgi:hypothetical protein
MRAGFFGTMHAAINLATSFDAVTDYFAITMGTGRRQHVNRAFEAVKGPSLTTGRNLKRLVVIVSANIALSHNVSWLIQPDFVYARENGRVAEHGPLACAPSGHIARVSGFQL